MSMKSDVDIRREHERLEMLHSAARKEGRREPIFVGAMIALKWALGELDMTPSELHMLVNDAIDEGLINEAIDKRAE